MPKLLNNWKTLEPIQHWKTDLRRILLNFEKFYLVGFQLRNFKKREYSSLGLLNNRQNLKQNRTDRIIAIFFRNQRPDFETNIVPITLKLVNNIKADSSADYSYRIPILSSIGTLTKRSPNGGITKRRLWKCHTGYFWRTREQWTKISSNCSAKRNTTKRSFSNASKTRIWLFWVSIPLSSAKT